jgi:hypothetical protein
VYRELSLLGTREHRVYVERRRRGAPTNHADARPPSYQRRTRGGRVGRGKRGPQVGAADVEDDEAARASDGTPPPGTEST